MKKLLLPILFIAAFAAPSLLVGQGMAWHLAVIDIKQIPDNYGGFTDTPDIYYVLKEGSTVLFTSTTIDDTDPPVSFYPNLALDSNKTYIIEVWDYDLLNADDELGQVSIPGKGFGNLFDSLSGSSGRLELYYEFQFKTVGFEDEISIVEEFVVYPNPAKGFVNVRVIPQVADDFQIQIMDLAGRVLRQDDLGLISGQLDHRIELDGLSAGSYFIHLQNEKGRVTRKLVLQP